MQINYLFTINYVFLWTVSPHIKGIILQQVFIYPVMPFYIPNILAAEKKIPLEDDYSWRAHNRYSSSPFV